MRPEIALVYAVFDDLGVSLCPVRTSAYQPGCSTVAVHLSASIRARDEVSGVGQGMTEVNVVGSVSLDLEELILSRYSRCDDLLLLYSHWIASMVRHAAEGMDVRHWVLGQGLLLLGAMPRRRDACSIPSQAWQWSIPDPAYRSSTTRCRSHSLGVDAPRSEP